MPEDIVIALPEDEDKPDFRDRTRGKSKYIRKALVKIFNMSPLERKAHKPKNGWEEVALAHFDRCLNKTSPGSAALVVVRDTLGERMQFKDTIEHNSGTSATLVDDMPRPSRKAIQ